jgi:hypothetical protein
MNIETLLKGKPLSQSKDFMASLNYEWKEFSLEYIINRYYKGNKNAYKFINILISNNLILKKKGIINGRLVSVNGCNSYRLPEHTLVSSNNIDIRWRKAKKHLSKLEDKYCRLVWYARSDKYNLLSNEVYEALSSMNEIESLYKDDVDELLNDETNWQHGFNSGMLAGIRLVIGMMNKDGYQDSIDEFPFLDT